MNMNNRTVFFCVGLLSARHFFFNALLVLPHLSQQSYDSSHYSNKTN